MSITKQQLFGNIDFQTISQNNGATPENQTILNILDQIANRIGENQWQLKREGQQTLF